MEIIKQANLYFKEGSSDKVYQAQISKDDLSYTVTFAYGRRGNALTTGQKTPIPVTLEQATKIFDKLILEKTSKGYKSEDGEVILTHSEKIDTGVRPQLLNECTEEEVQQYILDDAWCAQEKFDGRRRLLINEDSLVSTNRKGQVVSCDHKILDAVSNIKHPFILDGEDLGEKLMVFDLLISGPYRERYNKLSTLKFSNNNIKVVPTAWTFTDKALLYSELVERKAEGIVFKKIDSIYKPGRPNSGGDHIKFKFYATASVVVGKVNSGKRSVEILAYDNTSNPLSDYPLVNIGNVTIYPNQEIPDPMDVIEVKYLYFYEGGSLFQPVYLNKRDDIQLYECLTSKLKVKPNEEE